MEKIKLTKWDSASYLKNEDDIAAYLQACFEEAPDDAPFIAKALGTVAKARGMTQLAKDAGMGRESLYKALAPGAKPRFQTIASVMKALNVKIEVVGR